MSSSICEAGKGFDSEVDSGFSTMMVTITAKTASEYAASRSAVIFSSQSEQNVDSPPAATIKGAPTDKKQRWDLHGRGAKET
jgi:hypothetical protein